MFLIDGSNNVSDDAFKLQKEFVKRLAKHFNISSTGPYGSVATYDSFVYTVAGFAQPDFNTRVDETEKVGLRRRMDSALAQAASDIARTGRKGRKIVVLLTAGRQASVPGSRSLNVAVKPLNDVGAQTFVVAIGSQPRLDQLVFAVESPGDVIQIQQTDSLPAHSQRVAKQIKERKQKEGNC